MKLSRLIPASGKVRAGLSIVIAFALIVVFGPLITSYSPQASGADVLQSPSSQHWFGTTQMGQDIFSQFVYGGRVSLGIGLFAGLLSQVVSVLVGLIGGYFRGVSDDLLYILTSVFLVIPGLPLLVILTGYLPTRGAVSIGIVIAITSWAPAARVLRAQTMSLANRDFVEAARASGESRLRIVFFEVMPNALPVVATGFIFSTIAAILAEAGLSFLGLGSLTSVSWGSMLYFAQNSQALLVGAWWWFIPPGFAIALIGAGLALINFGIDEYANPRLRTGKSRGKAAKKPVRASSTVSSMSAPAITGAADDGVPSESAGEGPVEALESSSSEAIAMEPQIRAAIVKGEPVITVRDLIVDYGTTDGAVRAVDNVSITLHRGELLGLAGESGSGKTTLTNAITRLLRSPAEVVDGSITYHRNVRDKTQAGGTKSEVDLLTLPANELRILRWSELAIVFQSAMNALNPVTKVGAQFDDVVRVHRPNTSVSDRRALAREKLTKVGLDPDRIDSYPHELSGGMKQRVAIAIALVLEPDIIVMDEPTTALDLLIQREVLEQIMQLRDEYGFAIIFTTHDLSLLLEIADTIAVMQRGQLVEYAPALDLYTDPRHPYTQTLLDSLAKLGAHL